MSLVCDGLFLFGLETQWSVSDGSLLFCMHAPRVSRLERYALYCPCTLRFAPWLSDRLGITFETIETRGTTHGTQMSLFAFPVQ